MSAPNSPGQRWPVAILGATGAVGQTFIRQLANHPWFEIAELAASDRSAGRPYAEACRWLEGPLPQELATRTVVRCDPADVKSPLVFSALDSGVAGDVEQAFARAGTLVLSNAKNHRMDADVPLVIPEVNAPHLDLLESQRRNRQWNGGIVTNANCAATVAAMAMAPLHQAFGISQAMVFTMQAVSGAGYPGVASLDILGNVIPFIGEAKPKVATAAEAPSIGGSGSSKVIVWGLAAFASVALIALVFGSSWMAVDKTHLSLDLTTARVTKVTESGKAPNGAISSDGRYVAYIENDGDEYSLWVRQTATGGKAQVVPPQPRVLAHLAFSPGGEYIYFARGAARTGGFLLYRVPAIGGVETPILEDVDSPVSFSPDGRQFVFMRGAGSETHIVVAAAGGGAQRILATRTSPLTFLFVAPDWSPDGTMIAAPATDQSKGWRSSIIILPVAGGRGRELYTSDSRIGRARWLPDGSGLLAVVSEALSRQFPPWQAGLFVRLSGGSIWRIAYPDGRAQQLTSDLIDHDICCLDIGANGRTVLSVTNSLVSDLWIASTEDLAAPRQLSSGNPVVSRHSWLADNDTIVYRDLNGSLKAVHKDGRTFGLSLPDGYKAAGGVSACGDGRYVTFQAVPGNNIWRVTPSAGGAIKLTSGVADSNPACSPDGKWVVYSSMNTGRPSLWRVSIQGGEPTPLVESESYDALPSPSGQLIYYATFEWEKVPVPLRVLRWIVVSSTDHKRRFVLAAPSLASFGTLPAWAPDESGLDYVVTRSGVSNIWRQPLTGGPPVQITPFRTGRIFSFAWSPDGRWLSFASGVNRSDVVLMSHEP